MWIALVLTTLGQGAAPPDPESNEPAQAAGPANGPQRIEALRAELDLLLTPAGAPIKNGEAFGGEVQGRRMRDKLVAVALRSSALDRSLDDGPQRLAANQLRMRAYNALAQQALQSQRPVATSFRLAQLRDVAKQTKAIQTIDADITGDYWLLLADLIDINRTTLGLRKRQAQAIDRLAAFVHAQPPGPGPESPIVVEAKLALVRLYDQAGQGRAAGALLKPVALALGPNDPRRAELQAIDVRYQKLGSPVRFTVDTADGGVWSSADYLGRAVLVHLYDRKSPGLPAAIDELLAARREHSPSTLAVLSVDLGGPAQEATASVADVTWPRVEAKNIDPSVLDVLGVCAVPWFVLLDAEGRIAATAATTEILDHAARLLAPESGDTTVGPAHAKTGTAIGEGREDEPQRD